MKTVGAGLLAHLALGTTTLCTCWKVTRRDGQVFRFTDHVRDLAVPSDGTYLAATGYTKSAIETNSGLAVDNLEVSGWLDSSAITEADLLAGKWDFAEIRVFEVNYLDVSQGTLKLRRGWLGEVSTTGTAFTAELRGLMQSLQQNIGRVVSSACDADVFDARCGLDAGTFPDGTVAGTITSVSGTEPRRVFADTGPTMVSGWFNGGLLTWTAGLNAGLSMEIRAWENPGGLIQLVLPMPYEVQVGDTYTMTAGCDKRITTCRDKFNNVVNFRGFPHVPGPSRISSGT